MDAVSGDALRVLPSLPVTLSVFVEEQAPELNT